MSGLLGVNGPTSGVLYHSDHTNSSPPEHLPSHACHRNPRSGPVEWKVASRSRDRGDPSAIGGIQSPAEGTPRQTKAHSTCGANNVISGSLASISTARGARPDSAGPRPGHSCSDRSRHLTPPGRDSLHSGRDLHSPAGYYPLPATTSAFGNADVERPGDRPECQIHREQSD